VNRRPHTVGYWLDHEPGLSPVTLAYRLDTHEAHAIIRASNELTCADPDDEAGWARAADAYSLAEAEFLAVHRDTEIIP